MKNKRRGFLVVLEGVTCTGKDEQAGILVHKAADAGVNIRLEIEPTKGPFGQVARASIENNSKAPYSEAIGLAKNLLSKFPDTLTRVVAILRRMQSGQPVSILEKQIIFIMDRLWHCVMVLGPLLDSGVNVICVRFELSTFAFGISHGVEFADLLTWQDRILGSHYLRPDLTVHIRLLPETAVSRLAKNGKLKDIFETEEGVRRTASAYEKVIDFGRQHGRFGKIVEIDGEPPLKVVTKEILFELRNSSSEDFKKLK